VVLEYDTPVDCHAALLALFFILYEFLTFVLP